MLLLVLTREQRIADVELIKDAAEAPHVDGAVVGDAEHDLWRPIESGLDIGINFLIFKTTGAEIDDFDARLVDLPEENVLWLEVAVHDVVLAEEVKRYKDLNSEPLNQVQREAIEVVHFDKFVEVHGQHFKCNHEMLAERELVQAADDVLLVLSVVVVQVLDKLGLDEALLVQSGLVLQDLQSDVLLVLVVVGLQNHTETALAEFFDNFVAVLNMLVESGQIFIGVGVESVVCALIEHAHFRLRTVHCNCQ